ncbi:MAG: Uma2 family endonuclease [Candidatus Poribacteria bacterium]|nr:Uma2 family endonuclease [Candidatus Poribacteria bacterium]
MESYPNGRQIPYAPTETADLYPESDGKPMADTDLHIQWIIWLRQVLEGHFAQSPEVYISGNIMMYDIEGPLRTAVSPDILVSFGIGRKDRRTYKVWEEGKAPDFVMEFSSKRTYQNDLEGKVAHYAAMGIPEYFLYDVDRRYLPTPLMGYRLVEDAYIEVSPDVDGGLRSEVLNLNFHLLDDGLGVYAPGAGEWLQTPAEAATARAEQAETRAEAATARAEQAETRAEQAETRVQHEAEARQNAESEVLRLQEELARLKTR